jgi:UPF0042 nucleotide-binding protein
MLENKSVKVVYVCGISGAGLSTAISALEDVGLYCIDNIPIGLIELSIEEIKKHMRPYKGIAFALRPRNKLDVELLTKLIESQRSNLELKIIYLTAETDVLLNRFLTSRRLHPICTEESTLAQAIEAERCLLSDIAQIADENIETSKMSCHELKRELEKLVFSQWMTRELSISIVSFGFKYGQVKDCENLFDVRCLPNPYFQKKLKNFTGLDKEVGEFLLHQKGSSEFIENLVRWVCYTIPYYYFEGKHYLRIAIGCTGGKHRSVFVAHKLAETIREKKYPNTKVVVNHRDMELDKYE